MRRAARLAALALVGFAIGAAVAVLSLKQVSLGGETYQGWSGSRVTGSTEAGPVLRARVALTGLLALNHSQAIYFTRNIDDLGEPLREECQYRLSGGPLPGRWWSITAYAADNFLPQNSDEALSVDASEVALDNRGNWQAEVGTHRAPGLPWLSTRAAGRFDLTLRIYNPTRRAQEDFTSVPFPKVERMSCGDSQ